MTRYVIDTSTKAGESLAEKLSFPSGHVVKLTAKEMQLFLSDSCIDINIPKPIKGNACTRVR